MKIIRALLIMLASTLCALPSFAQWTTSSNDIYNSNSGNVGIGTSSPLYKLDVNGAIRIGTMVLSGGATGKIAIGGTVSGNNGIAIGENSTASQNAIAIGSNVIADLNSVSVGINGGAGSTAISIGIGSYAYQYSIALGFEAVTNNFHQLVCGGPNIPIKDIYYGRGITSSAPEPIVINANGASGSNLAGASMTIAGGKATGNADGGPVVLATSEAGSSGSAMQGLVERMRVTGKGNVLIGTTTEPAGYKLAVAGNVIAEKVKVKLQSSGWPDYVFRPGYNLPSLKETEEYIKRHQHLPGVPSAAEVEKDGIDLGDTQAALLKKIEELTLHLISQSKEIETLKNENKELKKVQEEIEAIKALLKMQ